MQISWKHQCPIEIAKALLLNDFSISKCQERGKGYHKQLILWFCYLDGSEDQIFQHFNRTKYVKRNK